MPSPENGTRQTRLTDNVTGIILAGGRNSRMGGADKAFLTVNGETVFERTLLLLRRCFPQVVVVSNHPEKYARFDVQVTADEFAGQGPLAGIHAALAVASCPYVFVVACDMPFLRPEPIGFLIDQLDGQDAVIARWDGDIEPLHALYSGGLRERIGQALRFGTTAIRELLPQLDVHYIPEAVMQAVPGAEESFRNINTPEDAARFAVRVEARGSASVPER